MYIYVCIYICIERERDEMGQDQLNKESGRVYYRAEHRHARHTRQHLHTSAYVSIRQHTSHTHTHTRMLTCAGAGTPDTLDST